MCLLANVLAAHDCSIDVILPATIPVPGGRAISSRLHENRHWRRLLTRLVANWTNHILKACSVENLAPKVRFGTTSEGFNETHATGTQFAHTTLPSLSVCSFCNITKEGYDVLTKIFSLFYCF